MTKQRLDNVTINENQLHSMMSAADSARTIQVPGLVIIFVYLGRLTYRSDLTYTNKREVKNGICTKLYTKSKMSVGKNL